MLRDTLLATVTALTVVGVYFISESVPSTRAPYPGEELRTVLDRRIAGVLHVRGSLREAIDRLVASGAPIDVRWTPDWPHVSPTDRIPIDLRLRDGTIEQWLQAINFQLNGQVEYWVGAVGRIKIHDDCPPVGTRVYDVRDLVDQAMGFNQKFVRKDPDPWADAVNRPEQEWIVASDLAEMVCDLAGAWRGARTPARWHAEDGRLIVTETPEVHRKIQVLLAAWRVRQPQPTATGERP